MSELRMLAARHKRHHHDSNNKPEPTASSLRVSLLNVSKLVLSQGARVIASQDSIPLPVLVLMAKETEVTESSAVLSEALALNAWYLYVDQTSQVRDGVFSAAAEVHNPTVFEIFASHVQLELVNWV